MPIKASPPDYELLDRLELATPAQVKAHEEAKFEAEQRR